MERLEELHVMRREISGLYTSGEIDSMEYAEKSWDIVHEQVKLEFGLGEDEEDKNPVRMIKKQDQEVASS